MRWTAAARQRFQDNLAIANEKANDFLRSRIEARTKIRWASENRSLSNIYVEILDVRLFEEKQREEIARAIDAEQAKLAAEHFVRRVSQFGPNDPSVKSSLSDTGYSPTDDGSSPRLYDASS